MAPKPTSARETLNNVNNRLTKRQRLEKGNWGVELCFRVRLRLGTCYGASSGGGGGGLGVGRDLGVGVGLGVTIGVAVGVGLGVGDGSPPLVVRRITPPSPTVMPVKASLPNETS